MVPFPGRAHKPSAARRPESAGPARAPAHARLPGWPYNTPAPASTADESETMEVILTHEHADFDAVASQAGLARLLPEAVPVLSQTLLEPVRDFLVLYGREFRFVARDELPRVPVTRAWLVDTRSAQPVRGMTPSTPRTVLDHHTADSLTEDPAITWQVEAVGATSTLVAERLEAGGTVLGAVEATLLLLGIHDDTGSLTFAHTSARDLRAAAWLMDQGADLDVLQRFLRRPATASELALLAELEAHAEPLDVAGHALLLATGAATGTEARLATVAASLFDRAAPETEALVLVVDLGDRIQVVARSISDDVDVGALARALGGGGHRRAAAAVARKAELATVVQRLRAALSDTVRPAVRVADIMSSGPVRTLAASDTVGEAVHIARRFGHEGYPVLDDGRVVGVVTRRELDLAAHHHLSHTAVADLLASTPVTVGPNDAVTRLRRAMIDHDLGQMPVVQDERLVGIVTRTDLLRLWAEQSAERGEPMPVVDLDAALPVAWRPMVTAATETAAALGLRAYLVGGVVRDLLLGRALGPDVDLVVAGNAIALGEALAAAHGGQLRVHPAFGTATWRLGERSLDLISARAEYYTAPSELPRVEPSSLASDLRRRDFSINAMAVDLMPDRRGGVVDPFHGLVDLRQRRIRTLHSLSFVEDPTRILRALRYAVRLGFTLDPATAEQVPRALPLFARLSAARLRAEFLRVFGEPDPAALLSALSDQAVLQAVQPDLAVDARMTGLLADLPATWRMYVGRAPGRENGLALWLATQGQVGLAAGERLKLPARQQLALGQAIALIEPEHPAQAASVSPHALWRSLSGQQPEALALADLAGRSGTLRRNLRHYREELAGRERPVTGDDLTALGLSPGPAIGRILDAVWSAWLDGQLADRSAALALARKLVDAEAGSP